MLETKPVSFNAGRVVQDTIRGNEHNTRTSVRLAALLDSLDLEEGWAFNMDKGIWQRDVEGNDG